jgi:predicted  nucleic acid-binding Zn-ribbon protein
MSVLEDLLVVQSHDTAIDQLRHRRATLPERIEAQTVRVAIADNDAARATVQARHDDLIRDERRLDQEAATYETKAAEIEKRLYSGNVTIPKELQAMQSEVDQFRRLRDGLEDRELELMEVRESVDAELAGTTARDAALQARLAELDAAASAAESEIDAALAKALSERDALRDGIPDAVLTTYEDRRKKAGGIGIAKVIGLVCQGCRLHVPSGSVDDLRHQPPDTLGFCDNCGAILVI